MSTPSDPQSQPILPNGMPWRQHLYLMIVSAKLLADTEAMLQMSGGQGGGPEAAMTQQELMQQMMQQVRKLRVCGVWEVVKGVHAVLLLLDAADDQAGEEAEGLLR